MTTHETPEPPSTLELACPTCASQLRFAPGTTHLTCVRCGTTTAIEVRTGPALVEQPYDEWERDNDGRQVSSLGGVVLTCEGCHATTESAALASICQFCRGHLVPVTQPDGVVPPSGVLPFLIDRRQAADAFVAWVNDRDVGVDELKNVNAAESFTSTYLPLWTFSATATTAYEGQRGIRKAVRLDDGRVELRADWHDVSGSVDTPVASHVVEGRDLGIGQSRIVRKLDLTATVPFQPEYLAGHTATRYDVDPAAAFDEVRRKVEKKRVRNDVRDDIGGDETRIESTTTTYSDVRFALLLAPLWVLTYIAGGKTWMVLVDGRTGQVEGEYPIDRVKFTLLVFKWIAIFVLGFVALISLPTILDSL